MQTILFGTLCACIKKVCLGKGGKDAERDYGRLAIPTRTARNWIRYRGSGEGTRGMGQSIFTDYGTADKSKRRSGAGDGFEIEGGQQITTNRYSTAAPRRVFYSILQQGKLR